MAVIAVICQAVTVVGSKDLELEKSIIGLLFCDLMTM